MSPHQLTLADLHTAASPALGGLGDVVLDLVLPGKPVGAARPRVTLRGGQARAYMPDGSVRWERALQLEAAEAWGDRPPLDEGVIVELVAVLPRPQRLCRRKDPPGRVLAVKGKPDLDNVIKLAQDALVKAGVVFDDTRVVAVLGLKLHAAIGEQPSTEVRVRRLA